MRRLSLLFVLALACNGPTAVEVKPHGTFALLQVEAKPLPIDYGPLPTRFGQSSGCNLILDVGYLSLDVPRQRYEIHTAYHNSCTNAVLSSSGTVGSYEQNGDRLIFSVPGNSPIKEFTGIVREDRITVDYLGGGSYVFSTTSVPAPVRTETGSHSIRRINGAPLPAPYPALIDGCNAQVSDAKLEFTPDPRATTWAGPATGHFELTFNLHNPCTGQAGGVERESGTYERIANGFYLISDLGPAVMRQWWGTLSDAGFEFNFGGWDLEIE